MEASFKSTHNLVFYDAPDHLSLIINCIFSDKAGNTPIYRRYKIGTCHGLWSCYDDCYHILAVLNDEPGNGHFTDVLEIFEHSAKRDGYDLIIEELWNKRLEKHLIKKRGYKKVKKGVIKYYN